MRRGLARDSADTIERFAGMVSDALRAGGKILLCGNGGSAADSQHRAAEFVGNLERSRPRRALAAFALTTDASILTALGNDLGFEQIFARQVEALGRPGDLVVGLSTSGKSPNVLAALATARRLGLATVFLAGQSADASCADLVLRVPSSSTALIQECHLAVGHAVCAMVERELIGGDPVLT